LKSFLLYVRENQNEEINEKATTLVDSILQRNIPSRNASSVKADKGKKGK
jgi:hypothetical protein